MIKSTKNSNTLNFGMEISMGGRNIFWNITHYKGDDANVMFQIFVCNSAI